MKKKIIFLLVSLAWGITLTAQDKIDSLQTAPFDCDSIVQSTIKVKDAKINCLIDSNRRLQLELRDANNTVASQKKLIEQLKQRLAFSDTVFARLSNECLRKKYDTYRVDEAINNFDSIYSPELRNRFVRLRSLLVDYETYNNEIVDIFNEAEKDEDLNENFVFSKERANYFIEKIKSSRYYKEAYDANWTIPYMNDLLDNAIKVLNSYDPQKGKPIELINLMH